MGEKVINFKTNDIRVKFNSEYGFNDVKYPYAYGDKNISFMLHQKYIPFQENEKSTEKTEYEYLYKLDDDIKDNNITDEKEGIVKYGNDFSICRTFHSEQKKIIVIYLI